MLGPPMLVRRIASLGDHALPPLDASALPGRGIIDLRHSLQRPAERKRVQKGAALGERQRRDIAPVQPDDVEYMIDESARAPRDLAVEDGIINRQRVDRGNDRREVLWFSRA